MTDVDAINTFEQLSIMRGLVSQLGKVGDIINRIESPETRNELTDIIFRNFRDFDAYVYRPTQWRGMRYAMTSILNRAVKEIQGQDLVKETEQQESFLQDFGIKPSSVPPMAERYTVEESTDNGISWRPTNLRTEPVPTEFQEVPAPNYGQPEFRDALPNEFSEAFPKTTAKLDSMSQYDERTDYVIKDLTEHMSDTSPAEDSESSSMPTETSSGKTCGQVNNGGLSRRSRQIVLDEKMQWLRWAESFTTTRVLIKAVAAAWVIRQLR